MKITPSNRQVSDHLSSACKGTLRRSRRSRQSPGYRWPHGPRRYDDLNTPLNRVMPTSAASRSPTRKRDLALPNTGELCCRYTVTCKLSETIVSANGSALPESRRRRAGERERRHSTPPRQGLLHSSGCWLARQPDRV